MRKIFLIHFLVFFSAITAFSQSKISVKISAEAIVEADIVKLGNIAVISNGEKTERMKNISLGYAPVIGALKEITRRQIILAFSAAGFSETDVSLDAPQTVQIRRASQLVGESILRGTVEKTILEKFDSKNITAKLTRLDVPPEFAAPKGNVEVSASVAKVVNFFEPFIVSLEVKIDGKIYRRLSATAQIEAETEVLVFLRDVPAYEKLSPNDVTLEKRKLTNPLDYYVQNADSLSGAITLQKYEKGSELLAKSLAQGIVVKMGDLVKVEAESGNLSLTIRGEARGNGKIGDNIPVKNLESGTILQAKIVEEGLVKIKF